MLDGRGGRASVHFLSLANASASHGTGSFVRAVGDFLEERNFAFFPMISEHPSLLTDVRILRSHHRGGAADSRDKDDWRAQQPAR
jgi:hypothetical protein